MAHLPPRFLLVAAFLSVGLSLGCRSDATAGLTPTALGKLFAQLVLNHHAITMALTPPYDTLQLVATPQSALGTPLADTGTTRYTILNGDTSVTVSATGLLRTVSPHAGVIVLASRTIGGVTQTDSALISINAVSTPVPVFTTLALQTQPWDSARTSISYNSSQYVGQVTMTAIAMDANGNMIPNVEIGYASSNPFVVPIVITRKGVCQLRIDLAGSVGQSVLTAEATIYGRSVTNSVTFTVGWPLQQLIIISDFPKAGTTAVTANFSADDDTIAAGGVVFWDNPNMAAIDVVFDSALAVEGVDSAEIASANYGSYGIVHASDTLGGNIPAFRNDSVYAGSYLNDGIQVDIFQYFFKARRFPTVGTYRYRSTIFGTTGVIHVLPEFQVPNSSQR